MSGVAGNPAGTAAAAAREARRAAYDCGVVRSFPAVRGAESVYAALPPSAASRFGAALGRTGFQGVFLSCY